MDAVLDGKTGLLVDPFKVNEIAEAMKLLLCDPVHAKRLGEEGRNRVLNQFTGSVVAQQMLSLIDAQHR